MREATKLGLKVAAHAHGTEGINTAVRAGVSSIEHGSVLSDESIEPMKKHGTYLVPNLYIGSLPLSPETPAATVAKKEYLRPLVVQSLQTAYKPASKWHWGPIRASFRMVRTAGSSPRWWPMVFRDVRDSGAAPQTAFQNCDALHALCQLMSLLAALCLPAVMIETQAWRRLG